MKPERKLLLSLGLLLGLLALLAGGVLAGGGTLTAWQTLTGAGGGPASGSDITLNATLGQPIIDYAADVTGPEGSAPALGAGYWYGLGYDETQCDLVDGGTYYFNQALPVSITINTQGNLACLSVLRVDADHTPKTGTTEQSGVGWGRYWTITADSTTDLKPAAGFNLTLTLPNDQGYTNPRLCRYTANPATAGWDCDDGSHTTAAGGSVTRRGITALSDWSVGSNVGSTALQLTALTAHSRPDAGGLLTVLVLAVSALGLGVLHRRRRG